MQRSTREEREESAASDVLGNIEKVLFIPIPNEESLSEAIEDGYDGGYIPHALIQDPENEAYKGIASQYEGEFWAILCLIEYYFPFNYD